MLGVEEFGWFIIGINSTENLIRDRQSILVLPAGYPADSWNEN